MCAFSMVVDHKTSEWQERLRGYEQYPYGQTGQAGYTQAGLSRLLGGSKPSPITNEEVAEFRRLLDRAREYDKKTNQANCELQEKKTKLIQLAEELGYELSFEDD